MDVMPHSSLRLHPWIKSSRPQSPEPLRHSRQHDTLHGGTGSRSFVTGWEDSNAGLGTCSADFQGLFYNSACCKHSSLSCCKPRPRFVPRKRPAVLHLPVASATAAHNVPYGLGPHLPHAEAPQLLEAALVTAPCPCTLPVARALFSSHHMSLFQAEATAGVASLWEAAACQTHSWQLCLAATAANQPHSRPWLAKTQNAVFVSGYTLPRDASAGIWSLETWAATARLSHQSLSVSQPSEDI